MKRILKWVGIPLACIFAIIASLLLGTRGDYPVARLVSEDTSLPSETIAGIQLHMRVIKGPEGAPVIIVLHGGPGGDFRSLQSLATLSDQFTVVFYDQRGAGLSQRVSPEQLTLAAHLDELRGVIDRVSPNGAPIVIGHSWGAILAAAYLGQNPDDVLAAVLIEPGYLDAAGRENWRQESQTYLSGIQYWREALLTGFRAWHVSGPDSAAQEDFLIGHMVGVFANHPNNPYHCGEGYTAPNWRFGATSSQSWNTATSTELERLVSNTKDFDGSVLFMAGECNDWIGAALQEGHVDMFSQATLTVVPDAGHDVIWDNPVASISAIRTFLTNEDAGR